MQNATNRQILRPIDLRFLDQLFLSSPGYVLDFTNPTFGEFFTGELGVNIFSEKYAVPGLPSTSKGKRLRRFLEQEPAPVAGRALRALWEYRELLHGRDQQNEDRFFALVHALDGKGRPAPSAQSAPSVAAPTPSSDALARLNTELMALAGLKPQDRGFAFERLLSELFHAHGLSPRGSFRLVGEQIDGSFQLLQETFLLEAKWQAVPTGQADLLVFSSKVEAKSQWSQGLFISYCGFTADGLQAFARGRSTNIVCMDGLDLSHVLSGAVGFTDVIRQKKRRAAETGSAFVSVRDLFNL